MNPSTVIIGGSKRYVMEMATQGENAKYEVKMPHEN